jgi:DNA-directed RNA polymerase III subunit RPC1
MEVWKDTFRTAIEEQREIGQFLSKANEDLNPLKVLDLFRRISAEVCP